MKKERDVELEKQPLAVGEKILEMKRGSEEANRPEKVLHIKDAKREARTLRERLRAASRAVATPISTRIKRVHSLGDFYGKFHPSKSNKGIKRSE